MRLYASKVKEIAREIVQTLTHANDIETESKDEVEADVASVLNQYLAAEKDVSEKAKDLIERTGRSSSDLGRVKAQIAETRGIKTGDDALDYILDQLVEILHYSQNVEEIYCEDVVLRRKARDVFRRHAFADDALDAEVRGQIKHVKEGTRTWDIEYARVMEATRRKRGLA